MHISPQRILIIKLSSLGDIVHALPAVSALRQQFPRAHFTWLVKTAWSSILEGNPDIDEVISSDFSWNRWPHLIRILREKRFDVIVDFQGLLRSGLLGLLTGARVRVGFARAREGATWFYTHRVPLADQQTATWRLLDMHAVDRNLAIAQYLGAQTIRPMVHLPEFAEDDEYIEGLLRDAGVGHQEHLIALAPWSRSPLKSWPLDRFVEVAQTLMMLPGVRVVIVGGPSEKVFANAFRTLESQGLLNVVGQLSLRQLPVLLRRMRLIVGNDSSLIHLAAGVDVPVLAIFGPTNPRATGPYPLEKHSVVHAELSCRPCGKQTCANPRYLDCLHSLTVTSIVDDIHRILNLEREPRDQTYALPGDQNQS
jgi:heptosyltransferase-1